MVEIKQRSSLEAGSCSGCKAGIGPNGSIDIPVTEITISTGMYGATVRLCGDCLLVFSMEIAPVAVAAARKEALEEAARVCEDVITFSEDHRLNLEKAAAAIRALAEGAGETER